MRDWLYTWIGGYPGFKAVYDVDEKSIKKVEMTLTLRCHFVTEETGA